MKIERSDQSTLDRPCAEEGFVYFDWLPTIIDPDDDQAMYEFANEIERIATEVRKRGRIDKDEAENVPTDYIA